MADSPSTQKMSASELDTLIKGVEGQFNSALERLKKNGPSDTEAAGYLLAASTRYEHLEMIRRGYFR